MTRLRLEPPEGPLSGIIEVPGDKSIAHRAVLLNALGEGSAHLQGLPGGRDVACTIAAVRALGVEAREAGERALTIRGSTMRLGEPPATIDCGNSGTTMRLLTGVLAGQGMHARLDGDASLRRRPMSRVADPLRAMGAEVRTSSGGHAPLEVRPARLRPCTHELEVASAQVKSALLLAGLQAEGRTCVKEPARSRDHTERLLRAMGVEVHESDGAVSVEGPAVPVCRDVVIPGDPSSAAFVAAAAAVVPGSEVVVRGVCINPTRTGFVHVLRRMGADIEVHETGSSGGEPVGELHIRHRRLEGVSISEDEVPSTIDELPVLAVAAALARGETSVRGARELRVKESDRIEAIASMLGGFGVQTTTFEDGFRVQGTETLRGGACIHAAGDHRIAMAAAVASLRAGGTTALEDAEVVSVSFPGFFDCLRRLTG